MTGQLLDEDPELALRHAIAARKLASRIATVREAVGLAAYRAGEWQTAIAEIRTYHRMTGRRGHLAILADCERALGRPERAIDIYRSAEGQTLGPAETIELLIVASGARRDMEQKDAAVAMLQVRELSADAPWTARLRYAYADALLDLGRRDEARDWFSRAVDADPDGETDAADRLLDLDGILIEEDETDDPELALALAHGEIDDRASAARAATSAANVGPDNAADDEDNADDAEEDDADEEDGADEDGADAYEDGADADEDDDDDDGDRVAHNGNESGDGDGDENGDDNAGIGDDENGDEADLRNEDNAADDAELDGVDDDEDEDHSDEDDLEYEDYVPPSQVTVDATDTLSEPIGDLTRPESA
jgi:tetratricopeptide (TPR) repeat protein